MRILVPIAALLLAVPLSLAAFREGPLPNMTGAFGEPNCHQCHLDNPIDAPGGRAIIEGVPPVYVPGRDYTITVKLTRAGAERGGFEIAARFGEGSSRGRQAGAWRVEGPRLQMISSQADPALVFVQHTTVGTKTETPGTISWTMTWTAPSSMAEAVSFDVAANGSNDDASPLGDYIYLAHATAGAPFVPEQAVPRPNEMLCGAVAK